MDGLARSRIGKSVRFVMFSCLLTGASYYDPASFVKKKLKKKDCLLMVSTT